MQTDYFKLLKDSAEFSWKYKILWVFGFIVAFLSGGSSSNSNINFNNSQDQVPEEFANKLENFSDKIADFIKTPTFWVFVLAAVVVSLILTAALWYLLRVAKTSLIRAVVFKDEGKQLKIKKLWKDSHQYLVKLLVFDGLWILVTLPFALVIIGLIALGFITFPLGFVGAMCIVVPVAIVLSIVANILKFVGERLVVLKKVKALKAFKQSVILLKDNFKDLFVAWLYMLLPGCLVTVVLMIPMFLLMLPLLLALIPLFLVGDTIWLGVLVGICGMGIINLIFSAIQAPFVVFKETYWTKVMRKVV